MLGRSQLGRWLARTAICDLMRTPKCYEHSPGSPPWQSAGRSRFTREAIAPPQSSRCRCVPADAADSAPSDRLNTLILAPALRRELEPFHGPFKR